MLKDTKVVVDYAGHGVTVIVDFVDTLSQSV